MSSSKILSRWGVIGVSGNDAVSFLHAQLSNDIATLDEKTLRIAGLCSAKGRLFSTFFVFRKTDEVFLICRQALIPNLVKRLSMFVLRSKCKVMDLTPHYALEWLNTLNPADPCMTVTWSSPTEAHLTFRAFDNRLAGLRMVARSEAQATTTPENTSAGDDAFEEALFNLGITHIAPNLVEQFIPQAINLDLIGGISFSKGCYPGQEVVARSHYLGKLKRRTFKAKANAPLLETGADVWMEGKDNEPVGQLVNTIKSLALVELPIELVETEGAVFVVKTENGPTVLNIELPPYDVHQKGDQFEDGSTNTGLK